MNISTETEVPEATAGAKILRGRQARGLPERERIPETDIRVKRQRRIYPIWTVALPVMS